MTPPPQISTPKPPPIQFQPSTIHLQLQSRSRKPKTYQNSIKVSFKSLLILLQKLPYKDTRLDLNVLKNNKKGISFRCLNFNHKLHVSSTIVAIKASKESK